MAEPALISRSCPGDRAAYLCELRRVVEGHGCRGGRLCRGVVAGSLRTTESADQHDDVTATATARPYLWVSHKAACRGLATGRAGAAQR